MELKDKKILVGVCAMSKKTMRVPMISILENMMKNYGSYLDIIYFSDNTILLKSIDEWPIVDALITFYSTGFPIEKAIKYVTKYQPFVINDLEKQIKIMDRDCVLSILNDAGISHPEYGIVKRNDNGEVLNNFEEYNDYIIIDGKKFMKPFVEKPISGEDHNVYIYYHSSQGSGCRMLFRKKNNMSSMFSKTSNVRRDKSYLYEKFIETSNIDVKCYAVGSKYCYAESRKAPAVDGVIERDINGKERREEVILTKEEMEISSKLVKAFNHTVCGFDILRDGEKSYVCDVNGFSFVKGVKKYYEEAGNIIGEIIYNNFYNNKETNNNNVVNENIILSEDFQNIPLEKYKYSIQQKEDNITDFIKEEYSKNKKIHKEIIELSKIKVLQRNF
ncbi:ATP-grasp fold domain and ATP-grasp fold,RimK-type domain-containing protein [Strongyloides ratti]|uniref:ATP-grasp fold domain and ATP-grasp fold,RimK-type domain-containing protein n=1 Tax=Strongyloides ratti TaxID=34506 RepID=A0A090KW21_STRRB|nr:ATP-grasp fold domain and ATP-grasp fold,RimK-type domain-containing protein [Strongyloides ratti]CEF59472.1 ATP-grasp fold domain and ATP-grasp fold,RimK-type domain-containing protein [Strongyloides ratti]